jgi:hypothetical protein
MTMLLICELNILNNNKLFTFNVMLYDVKCRYSLRFLALLT